MTSLFKNKMGAKRTRCWQMSYVRNSRAYADESEWQIRMTLENPGAQFMTKIGVKEGYGKV